MVVKLPMSLTSVRSEPLYLHLAKALNGLRIASQEWICYLSGIVSELKLRTDGLEPRLFAGELRPGVPCMILVYVDDLLIAAPTAADVDKVINTIGKHVVLRKTGMIEASHSGGGQLKFLGRLLCRRQGERSMFHRACPVFLYGVLWVGWVGGSPCGVEIANLFVAIRLVSWIA